MIIVIIGKIVSISTVAHNKQLHETKQRIGITVARVRFIIHYLLHGSAWTHFQTFQLDLYNRDSINQQNHIIPVIAILGI